MYIHKNILFLQRNINLLDFYKQGYAIKIKFIIKLIIKLSVIINVSFL